MKHLVIHIDNKLAWTEQIKCLNSKLSKVLYNRRTVKQIIYCHHLKIMYTTLVQRNLLNGITLWGSTYQSYLMNTLVLQERSYGTINKSEYNSHTACQMHED